MARTKDRGNGRLEEAMTLLIHNQAAFVTQMAEINRRFTETEQINSERFARIERLLLEHSRILAEHGRTLQALPDAVRDKIGFKSPETPA